MNLGGCDCCGCDLFRASDFQSYQDYPSGNHPSLFWISEGGTAVSTTLTGKRLGEYPFYNNSSGTPFASLNGQIFTFTLDLVGTNFEFDYNYGLYFDSVAQTISNGYKKCPIGPPPWDVVIWGGSANAVVTVNGVRTLVCEGGLGVTSHGWILNTGTYAKISNFSWVGQTTPGNLYNGISCGYVGADSWFPHNRTAGAEITLTIASATARSPVPFGAFCPSGDCSLRAGTFILPFETAAYASSFGETTLAYKLTGAFGCAQTFIRTEFFRNDSLFFGPPVFGQSVRITFGGGPVSGGASGQDVYGFTWNQDANSSHSSPSPDNEVCGQFLNLGNLTGNNQGNCNLQGVTISY